MNLPSENLTVLPRCNERIEILSQTDDYVLIHKPAGLLSVPGRNPQNGDCVASRLGIEFSHVGIVHRLDFDTSGIMVVALNKRAHGFIARQFQERETYKRYAALVAGRPDREMGSVDMPIAPDHDNRPKCKICYQSGKRAVTRYQLLEYNPRSNISRLSLEPITGRSHQLRLHLAAIDLPILGCGFYASLEVAAATDRLMLHATDLHFLAPNGERVRGHSPCPF